MSTLKTTNLQHASAASPAIVLAADGSATAQLSSINGGPLAGSRNRVINGDMRIDQRNNGTATANTISGYTVDRWAAYQSVAGKIIAQRSAAVAPSGFTHSLSITSQSSYSVLAGDYYLLIQPIEGHNFSDLGWGTASARAVTLSFWAYSSLTGTFGGSLRNDAEDRSYVFSYAISAANTWEYKTITIPGPTSGTWQTGSSRAVQVIFSLGTGTTYSGSAGSWQNANLLSATGAISVVGTNGATFYITGVQLEAGTVATPFERRSYGQELALCQRYYETGLTKLYVGANSSTQVIAQHYSTRKRADSPSVTYSAPPAGSYNAPTSLEWNLASGFSANRSTGPEIAFAWTSSSEL